MPTYIERLAQRLEDRYLRLDPDQVARQILPWELYAEPDALDYLEGRFFPPVPRWPASWSCDQHRLLLRFADRIAANLNRRETKP